MRKQKRKGDEHLPWVFFFPGFKVLAHGYKEANLYEP